MSLRLLDADGQPRDRVLWLLLAALIASQLLALYALCVHQVQGARQRQAVVATSSRDGADCPVPVAIPQPGCEGPGVAPPVPGTAPQLPPSFAWR